ncbi:methyl-accepting chemotaxis protein [uncultured Ferrovibrio sp.]|jgi:methyl-accepting chemotaxis protein|uniref:methyl-accepting chemotaxis protein n=1 Tax=uncultured Ferrovibrio sp. TaxID=1576913 RepID=UPI00262AFF9D|nr:methyl-accepting chemotaxis protein [uncultured Ferrovibrio sp.]
MSEAVPHDPFATLGFLSFATTHLWEDRQKAAEAPIADKAIQYAIAAGRLLHELQRERGSSALYLGSRGQQFRAELQAARGGLDQAIEALRAAIAECRPLAPLAAVVQAADQLSATLDQARLARPVIDRLEFTAQQSFANWTNPIRLALTSIRDIGLLLRNPDLIQGLDAYLAILEGLEKSAQERATGSGALAAGGFELAVYQRFLILGALQEADFATFRSRATAGQAAFFDTVLREPVFAEVARLRQIIYDGFAQQSDSGRTGGIAAPDWFRITTQRIDAINRVRDRIAEDLQAICKQLLAMPADGGLRRALQIGFGVARLLAVFFGGSKRLAELHETYRIWRAGAEKRHEQARAAAAARDTEQQQQAERLARERVAAVEVTDLVNRIVAGDLSSRLSQDGKDGFFLQLSQQLNRLAEMLQAMVGELAAVTEALGQGDLTRKVEGHYEGIFGQLKDSANRMAVLLGDFSLRLAESAEAVRVASSEISASSQDLAQRTQSQASSIEETAASMHEVTVTVKHNADNAQAANQLAMSAHEIAQKGGHIVQEAVAAVERIEGSAQKISDIIGLIDEIAFQTNLLALNASVEAARAGDAGKGFAVVAQEVRALAQRSANASKDIKALIAESNAQVKAGTGLVNQTGSALSEIVAAIKKVSDIVGEIAVASAEQATGLDQINSAVSNLDEMTQRNAAMAEQATASASTLSHQASQLAALVGFFKQQSDFDDEDELAAGKAA